MRSGIRAGGASLMWNAPLCSAVEAHGLHLWPGLNTRKFTGTPAELYLAQSADAAAIVKALARSITPVTSSGLSRRCAAPCARRTRRARAGPGCRTGDASGSVGTRPGGRDLAPASRQGLRTKRAGAVFASDRPLHHRAALLMSSESTIPSLAIIFTSDFERE